MKEYMKPQEPVGDEPDTVESLVRAKQEALGWDNLYASWVVQWYLQTNEGTDLTRFRTFLDGYTTKA